MRPTAGPASLPRHLRSGSRRSRPNPQVRDLPRCGAIIKLNILPCRRGDVRHRRALPAIAGRELCCPVLQEVAHADVHAHANTNTLARRDPQAAGLAAGPRTAFGDQHSSSSSLASVSAAPLTIGYALRGRRIRAALAHSKLKTGVAAVGAPTAAGRTAATFAGTASHPGASVSAALGNGIGPSASNGGQ